MDENVVLPVSYWVLNHGKEAILFVLWRLSDIFRLGTRFVSRFQFLALL